MALVHVVDDDIGALRSVSEALAEARYKVCLYRCVASYLDLEFRQTPDLIIADVLSLKADAVEYLSALRGRLDLRTVPLIIMSQLSLRDGVRVDEILKERFGVAALLRKPCYAKSLTQVVTRALASAQPEPLALPPPEPAAALGQTEPERARLAAIPLRQMAAHPTAESRLETRFDASFEVSFENRDALVREYTQNISRGGLFVRTDAPPPQHSSVKLTLRLPHDSEPPITLQATVAHTTEPGMGAPSGFGARLTQTGRDELERWFGLVEGVKRRSSAHVRGPKVLLLGFSNERAAELTRHAGLLCRQEVSVVPLASWQSVAYEARRAESKKKLLLIDVGDDDAQKRAGFFDATVVRELASIPNAAVVYVGLQAQDEVKLPTDQHVIRAGTLTTADLVGAVVSWLQLPSRNELRVPFAGALRIEDGDDERRGKLLDVSVGGARFLSLASFECEKTIKLYFVLPGRERIDGLLATVRWSKAEGRGMHMCGVQFKLDGTSPARDLLRRYVDQQALLLRSLEGLRRGAPTEEKVRKIVPLDDEM